MTQSTHKALRRATLLPLLFLASCAQGPDGQKAQHYEAAPSAAEVRGWMDAGCARSGKRVGIDYPSALERAIRGEAAGLAELFRYTDTGEMDGEAGEAHSAILFGLLQRWGDRRFAQVLRGQSARVRKAVIGNLPLPPERSSEFPLTSALAPS